MKCTSEGAIAVIITLLCRISDQYKPVFLLHGVSGNSTTFEHLIERINQAHPGTVIHNSNAYPDARSLTPLPVQIAGELGEEFRNFSMKYPDGFHFIGFSQGSVLSRGLIESYEEHTVQNYIAISGPMAGQYGPSSLGNFPLPYQTGFLVFYNPIVQRAVSISNYWNDPNHQDLYQMTSIYLPYIDNQVLSSSSESYRRSFTKLKNLICIGGPQDGVISPWQSSHFSYIQTNGEIINYRERELYMNDSFGLRTLDQSGRFHIFEKSDVFHSDWASNDDVIDRFILPFLD
nr:PREDICTED: lysosomal thioesterase PPT2 homolog [Bemisia tabaci]